MRIIRFQEEVRNETASIAAAIEYALWTLNRNVIAYIDLLGEHALKRIAP